MGQLGSSKAILNPEGWTFLPHLNLEEKKRNQFINSGDPFPEPTSLNWGVLYLMLLVTGLLTGT